MSFNLTNVVNPISLNNKTESSLREKNPIIGEIIEPYDSNYIGSVGVFGLEREWMTDTVPIDSNPSSYTDFKIVYNKIYVGTKLGEIIIMDKNGSILEVHKVTQGEGINALDVWSNGNIAFASGLNPNYNVSSYNPFTKEVIWTYTGHTARINDLIILDNSVITASEDGTVRRVLSGAVEDWVCNIPVVTGTPSVKTMTKEYNQDRVFIGTNDGRVMKIDLTGNIVSEITLDSGENNNNVLSISSASSYPYIIVTYDNNKIIKIDGNLGVGSIVWSSSTNISPNQTLKSVIVGNFDNIYVVDQYSYITKVGSNGNVDWDILVTGRLSLLREIGRGINRIALDESRYIYILNESGQIMKFNSELQFKGFRMVE